MEYKDTDQNCPHGSNARPYRIGGAQRQCLGRFGEKPHADDCENDETANPCPPFQSDGIFGAPEAVSKADLAEAGYN